MFPLRTVTRFVAYDNFLSRPKSFAYTRQYCPVAVLELARLSPGTPCVCVVLAWGKPPRAGRIC